MSAAVIFVTTECNRTLSMSDLERQQYVKQFTSKHMKKESTQVEDGLLEQFHAPWKNAMKKSQVAN